MSRAVPRCSAPRSAVADIPRERSTESSDASRGLRRGVHDLPSRQLHGRPGVCFRIWAHISPRGRLGHKQGPQIRDLTRVSGGPAPKNSSASGGDCSPSTDALSPTQDEVQKLWS